MFETNGNPVKVFVLAACVAMTSNFNEGYSNSYPNTAVATFKNYINQSYINRGNEDGLSEFAYSWIWSSILNIWFIGYLAGTLCTPYFTDKYGRTRTLLYSNLASFVGTLLSTSAILLNSPELLFVCRLIASVSAGTAFGALLLWLQETTHTSFRGVTSFLSESSFIAMNCVGMALGIESILGDNLTLLIGLGSIPAFIGFLIMIPLKDTPKFLLINKKDEAECKKSLDYYYGNKYDQEDILESIMKEKDESLIIGSWSLTKEAIITPQLRKAYFVGSLALQVTVGIWPVIYLSTDFLSTHFDNQTSQYFSLGFILSCFLANIPGIFVIERFGRRPLYIITAIVNILSLVFYLISDRLALNGYPYMRYGCVVSLISYGISYGFALGPIAFAITSEMVPQRSRSVVQSMVFATNTISNCIFSELTYPMYKWLEVWCFIPLFIIPSTISLYYLVLHFPETKDKEVYQIVKEMIGDIESNSSKSEFFGISNSIKSDDKKTYGTIIDPI
uniref:MFS domain-containing protein n=1 Tax=Rhabditophanes sp. KR3021 TaxID=114890 RepID=A0AC35U4B8_9BILA